MASEYKIILLNVSGLKHVSKRKRLFRFLREENIKLVCLQEMHLNTHEPGYLEHVFRGHNYHAPSLGRSGGVMVGIVHALPWVLTDRILDKGRRYVILRGRLHTCRLTIVGVYAPNGVQTPFWEKIFKILMQDVESEILLLGYFNSVIDKQQDRSKVSSIPSIPVIFYRYKELLGLIDVWRMANEGKRDYTFYSYRHTMYSRIDYVFNISFKKVTFLAMVR